MLCRSRFQENWRMIRDHLAVVDDQITGPTHCADTLSNQCVFIRRWIIGTAMTCGTAMNNTTNPRRGSVSAYNPTR
jgi:hypothetical protein